MLFVQEEVAERLISMLQGAMEEIRIGDPLDYASDVGPVIDEAAREGLEAHKAAMRQQARELVDLPLPDLAEFGSYVSPAAYEIEDAALLTREVFGPILHVVRYQASRLDKVCEEVNATGYGLTLGIHSRIESTVREIVSRVGWATPMSTATRSARWLVSSPLAGRGFREPAQRRAAPITCPALRLSAWFPPIRRRPAAMRRCFRWAAKPIEKRCRIAFLCRGAIFR
jgi:RHH-type proline utilization regulon transcriptional repressor/proline dehydrogenase/delta 1-pyrroline-5-carboxylate dehydrogenase